MVPVQINYITKPRAFEEYGGVKKRTYGLEAKNFHIYCIGDIWTCQTSNSSTL